MRLWPVILALLAVPPAAMAQDDRGLLGHSGSLDLKEKSADYQMDANDTVISCVAASTADTVTITLPAGAPKGRQAVVDAHPANDGICRMVPADGDSVDGSVSAVALSAGQDDNLIFNGRSHWLHISPPGGSGGPGGGGNVSAITTTVTFGDTLGKAVGTIPANAEVLEIALTTTEAFNAGDQNYFDFGTATAPDTLISGDGSRLTFDVLGTTREPIFQVQRATPMNIIATYDQAGTPADAGAGRVTIVYAEP